MANAGEWLREALKLLYGDADHHKSCLHGCIDCILSAFSWKAVLEQLTEGELSEHEIAAKFQEEQRGAPRLPWDHGCCGMMAR